MDKDKLLDILFDLINESDELNVLDVNVVNDQIEATLTSDKKVIITAQFT